MGTREARTKQPRTAAAVHWVLVCLVSMLALLAGALRAPSSDTVRRGPFSLEVRDVRSIEQDPALTQHGEHCRVPAVRPAGGPPKSGPPRTDLAVVALRTLQAPIAGQFADRVVRGRSELYVWTPPAPSRAELMVFLN